jgi:hypothetical protein
MVRIHREPPVEGPPGGAVPYKHFGARLARLGRFDSCTLYQKMFRAGSFEKLTLMELDFYFFSAILSAKCW